MERASSHSNVFRPAYLTGSAARARRLLGAAMLFCGVFTTVAAAQSPPDAGFAQSISVGYVMVPFVALDGAGKAVKDLRQKQVKLLVGGAEVKTDLFERSDNAPVSFTFLLDVSGSMELAGKKEAALAAIAGLVRHRVKGDDYALYTFSNGEVRETVPFTIDPGKVYWAAQKITPFGRTAFYDALALMPDKTILGQNGSRAIVLLTDALDNASSLTRTQLTRLLEGVDVPVYAIGLRLAPLEKGDGSNPETLSDIEMLGEIARISGGRVFVGVEPPVIMSAVDSINNDLRTQYLVGFKPTGNGPLQYRTISLRLPHSVRVTRVRSGYRGTEPPMASRTPAVQKTKRRGT